MIRVAIAGLGNCAGALVEGLSFYRTGTPGSAGLLFEILGGYAVSDIEPVVAFDIAEDKVGLSIARAIYAKPNNFTHISGIHVDANGPVLRGPTFDGNPSHLQRFVNESKAEPVDVVATLREHGANILLNLLPTGSTQASEFYAHAASEAGCSFINCIPTPIAQRQEIQSRFAERGLILLGDDIKSQLGTTILHRALLSLLHRRGAKLEATSQINVGGNTDFANFVSRGESKLISKRKSLEAYCQDAVSHVGHHYDPTRGAFKTAFIEIEAKVFAGSSVRLSTRLDSDDKPNSAGSIVDLIRIAMAAKERGFAGFIEEACALYMKSPPIPMDDSKALELVRKNWSEARD